MTKAITITLIALFGLVIMGAAPPDHPKCEGGRYTIDTGNKYTKKTFTCPNFPEQLPELVLSVEMDYPKCVAKGNFSDFAFAEYWNLQATVDYSEAHRVKHNQWGGRINHSWEDVVRLERSQAQNASYNGLASLERLLDFTHRKTAVSDSGEYTYWLQTHLNYQNQDGFTRSVTFKKGYNTLRSNISAFEFGKRIVDCGMRLDLEDEHRVQRREKMEELISKQVDLEGMKWALQEEVRLQEDLLSLTRSIIEAQRRIDATLRQIREVRIKGIEARAKLWNEYSAQAAEETAEFFQQMQERHDNINAIQQSIEEDARKHREFMAGLEELEREATQALQDVEQELTTQDAEVQRIKQNLAELAE